MDPRVVEEKSTLKSFPVGESAPVLLRNQATRMDVTDQRGVRISRAEMPLTEEACMISPIIQSMGDRAGMRRKRIKICLDSICW